MDESMAKKSRSFNLSAVIREYRRSHPGVSANSALEAVKKAHNGQKINEGTFRATFYQLSGGGKKNTIRRRKPGTVVSQDNNHAEGVMRAGLTFIRLAGGVESARERLVGLEKLIETAKGVE
jgi:hypothetical protein